MTRQRWGALAVVLAVLLGLVALTVANAVDDSPSSARPPDRLPSVTLQPLRQGDSPVALRDLRGPMVVNLWAQWCGPCRDELPYYQQFHTKHPQVPVLGVDWLDLRTEKAIALADQVGLTYPLVVDPDKEIASPALPSLILIDADGHIAYRNALEIKSLAQLEGLVRKHLGVDL